MADLVTTFVVSGLRKRIRDRWVGLGIVDRSADRSLYVGKIEIL